MTRYDAPTVVGILHFIRCFTTPKHRREGVVECFTNGCCYWFAKILSERFEGGVIVYNHSEAHFATRIDCIGIDGELRDRVFDITGELPDGPDWEVWDDWENHKNGKWSGAKTTIYRNCALKQD